MPILQTIKHKILCHEHKINKKPNRPTASQPILQLPIKKRSKGGEIGGAGGA